MALRESCEARKYVQRADSWFGVALRPDGGVCGVVELIGAWKRDPAREAVLVDVVAGPRRPGMRVRRIGRNDRCHCGSGKKYKYCCIGR